MIKSNQPVQIIDAELARVTGGGIPPIWALPAIMVGYVFSDRNKPRK